MGRGSYRAGVSVLEFVLCRDLTELCPQEDLSDNLIGPHTTLLDKQTITLSHPEGKEGWKGVLLEPGKATIVGRREVCTFILVWRVG